MTQDLWSFCLLRLEQELPQQQFNTWIKTLRAELGDGSAWTLIAPNRFVLQWVRERYLRRIQELGEEHAGVPVQIELQLPPAGSAPAKRSPSTSPAASVATPPAGAIQASADTTASTPAAEPAPIDNTASDTATAVRRRSVASATGTRDAEPASGLELAYDKTRLNPDFTFDTLVTGRANDLARA
ncbi:MAG TPA: DnaA N-terminal domain-containing protein, partial [Thauera sp.]|nr:DnaA N-terminal domain-containing protein [Thauera sp.]